MPRKSTRNIAANACALRAKNFSSATLPPKLWPKRERPIRTMTASLLDTFPKKGRTESMRTDGLWHLCDDGVIRPVIQGEVLGSNGSWFKVPFLVDSGADRTVFSAEVINSLQLQPIASEQRLG